MDPVRRVHVVESFDGFYLREYPAAVKPGAGAVREPAGRRGPRPRGFLAAWRQWGRIGRYDQPAAWVRRVVANLAASTVRRRLAEVRAVARLMVGWQPDVEELSEASAEVWRAIRALPRQQAQALAMYYLLGCSVGEIAMVLDRSERSVKAYLHDGRDAVGRRLGLDVEELG